MGLFDRFRRDRRPSSGRRADDGDIAHLTAWAGSRRGVEAYLEPSTAVTETTVVLIAHDGEWTRRRVAGQEAAARWARKLAIPLYDVQKVGYPQRMRDYTARQRERERRSD
ncbi:hypothetical protein LX15_003777 [Streptoalloteichus tenebrarius]|uniref:Oxidoreductase n=1 Tax=Streptoalloteichus tenebrarius (strain ATCC 17920 / DSM 40477 / JCM 4838 / CBS 697.72 / NBRC 16177 / NCIMB 11028 / NRRL B-12390 / A12253. 1 / ISP 5477) TaxID=1933 RepID=A0ABT1HX21_STRSD|nr:oxidoreductase [Streptoalloteichus tenebrarius]MCP2260066.1 hypothetical protein [Streptoalloteichus tenebrarius]BFF00615.1 hypothetical protein GCM10020241_22900 [Streptoalloteichus tenebrarius]